MRLTCSVCLRERGPQERCEHCRSDAPPLLGAPPSPSEVVVEIPGRLPTAREARFGEREAITAWLRVQPPTMTPQEAAELIDGAEHLVRPGSTPRATGSGRSPGGT